MKLLFSNKQIILFSLLFIIWSGGFSKATAQTSLTQPCDCHQRLEQLSRYYTSQGEHKKSLEVFRHAMSYSETTTPYQFYYLATLMAANGDCASAKENLKAAILKGYDLTYIPYDKSLPNCLATSGEAWEEFMRSVQAERKNTTTNLDIEYLKALHDIRGSDQTIRRLIKVPDEIYAELDSINLYRLKKLIEENGYPDYQKHGFEDTQVAYLLFIHASRYSEEMYNDIIAIMKIAKADCNIRGSQIAQIIDARRSNTLEIKQLLGSANYYKKEEFRPIAQPEIIDSLRFEYNLLRITEQAIQEKRKLPEEYRPFPYPKNYFCGYEFEE